MPINDKAKYNQYMREYNSVHRGTFPCVKKAVEFGYSEEYLDMLYANYKAKFREMTNPNEERDVGIREMTKEQGWTIDGDYVERITKFPGRTSARSSIC